jgi:hypothetical protein
MVFTPTFDGPLFALTLVWALVAMVLTTAALLLAAQPAQAATTFTVTATGDEPDRNLADDRRDVSAVQRLSSSLRAPIQEDAIVPSANSIAFAIPGPVQKTIQTGSGLAPTTHRTALDGSSQGGAPLRRRPGLTRCCPSSSRGQRRCRRRRLGRSDRMPQPTTRNYMPPYMVSGMCCDLARPILDPSGWATSTAIRRRRRNPVTRQVTHSGRPRPVALIAALPLGVARPAAAGQTFTVNLLADAADTDPNDDGDQQRRQHQRRQHLRVLGTGGGRLILVPGAQPIRPDAATAIPSA